MTTEPPLEAEAVLTVLAGLFVLLLGAKVGEELLRRLGQPGVVGELLGGFVVGPSVLGLVQPGEAALAMAEIGVVILLFTVGLEVRLDDLLAVGPVAAATAVLGVVLPVVAGLGVALAVGEGPASAAFVGLALAATSIGITTRVLAEGRVLHAPFSRVILAAAVLDDVLALLLIGLVSGMARGDLSATTFFVALAGVGLLLLGLAAARRARGLRREVFTWPLFADTPLVPAFLLMLLFALVAAHVGLAVIIGAFVAGLIVAETEARPELETEMRPLGQIFTPFFFAITGAQVEAHSLLDPGALGLALVLLVVGVLSKVAAGVVAARGLGRWSSLAVGVGMVPRGEVGIVVGNLGLAAGVFSPALFGSVILAVVLTTLLTPFLLGPTIRRARG